MYILDDMKVFFYSNERAFYSFVAVFGITYLSSTQKCLAPRHDVRRNYPSCISLNAFCVIMYKK